MLKRIITLLLLPVCPVVMAGGWDTYTATEFDYCVDENWQPTFEVQIDIVDRFREVETPGNYMQFLQGNILFTNLETGKQLVNKWSTNLMYDFDDGVIYNNGAAVRVQGQGGIVILASGRLVIDLDAWEAVRQVGVVRPVEINFPDPEDDFTLIVCEALSG